MNKAKQFLTNIICKHSPNAYLNNHYEVIIDPKDNVYIYLDDIDTIEDVQIEVIHWLSRPCITVSNWWSSKLIKIFNEVLGTNFTKDDIELIYSKLGNGVDKELTKEFIKDFDLNRLTNNKK